MQPLVQRQSTEQGFSLLEPLVAILILAAVMAAFTPPLVLAVATRVRNFRVEQAIKVAQAEVDRNRRLIERQTQPGDLIPRLPPAATPNTADPASIGAPTSTTPNCNPNNGLPATALSWCPVPTLDGSAPTLGMQVFRTQIFNLDGTAGHNASKLPVAYRLGVRIYTIESLRQNAGSLETETRGLALSPTTQSLRAPLAVLYGPVARSDFTTTNESALRRICILNNQGNTDNCPEN